MNGFVIGFLGSIGGAILASLVGNWLDRRFRVPKSTYANAPIEAFSRWLPLMIGAVSAVCAWVCMILFLAVIAWALISERLLRSAGFGGVEHLLLGVMGTLLGLAVLYIAVAFSVRCPRCSRNVLVTWTSNPPFSETFFGFEGWSAIAVRVLVRRDFRCMYCGQRYSAARKPQRG
jgi:hypothetical protein